AGIAGRQPSGKRSHASPDSRGVGRGPCAGAATGRGAACGAAGPIRTGDALMRFWLVAAGNDGPVIDLRREMDSMAIRGVDCSSSWRGSELWDVIAIGVDASAR